MTKRDLDDVEMVVASELCALAGRTGFNMQESDFDLAIIAVRAERMLAELYDNPRLKIEETDTENSKRHVTVHFSDTAPPGYGPRQAFEVTTGEDRYFGATACRKLEQLFDWALREEGKDPQLHPLLQERTGSEGKAPIRPPPRTAVQQSGASENKPPSALALALAEKLGLGR